MKFCGTHWDGLQHEAAAMGLWGMVTHGGDQVMQVEALKKVPSNTPSDQLNDPLMLASVMILEKAYERGGTYLLWGDRCPLCELEANTETEAREWIEPCMQAVKDSFEERGVYREAKVQ